MIPAPPAIDIRQLRVDYGNFIAVDDLTLAVPQGEVFGLVGPNGAGKTSTFRVLATLQTPTYGSVRLAGIDIFEAPEEARRILGYMPDLAPVPSDMKVWEFLDLSCESFLGGNASDRRTRWQECLEQVQLSDRGNAMCRSLSRGQTQRLVLARTLLHRPKVMVLDEPASGMDPLSRRNLRLTLRHLAAAGATIIISSHILSELAEMCTSLCVMNRGRLLSSGTADEVRHALDRKERGLTISVLAKPDDAAAWLRSQPDTADVSLHDGRISLSFSGTPDAQANLLEGLFANGFRLTACEERKSSFEDLLISVAEQNS
ncbi:MAG: ABC-2 type transport system ATP-binding protein [Verrucomicrobia bacterium]|nr:MAG: ABC-2 type transport system ATP-binding protein [Verrucomicrobiota bacterium]